MRRNVVGCSSRIPLYWLRVNICTTKLCIFFRLLLGSVLLFTPRHILVLCHLTVYPPVSPLVLMTCLSCRRYTLSWCVVGDYPDIWKPCCQLRLHHLQWYLTSPLLSYENLLHLVTAYCSRMMPCYRHVVHRLPKMACL